MTHIELLSCEKEAQGLGQSAAGKLDLGAGVQWGLVRGRGGQRPRLHSPRWAMAPGTG